jgi:chromosome segregation ATPase
VQHSRASAQAGTSPASTAASRQSLLADLANLQQQTQRLRRQNHSLTARLSEILGAEVFHASGIGHADETGQLRTRVTGLEQLVLDLRQQLEERTDELDAARSANRDLMAQLNHAKRHA